MRNAASRCLAGSMAVGFPSIPKHIALPITLGYAEKRDRADPNTPRTGIVAGPIHQSESLSTHRPATPVMRAEAHVSSTLHGRAATRRGVALLASAV